MSQCLIKKFRNEMQRNVKKYGCSVVGIQGGGLSYVYSVGIGKSFGAPEVIVFALSAEMSHFVINEYITRVKEGEQFQHRQLAGGFLRDFECLFIEVHTRYFEKYMAWCEDFYGGGNFRALQMIIPTTEGLWPWENNRSAKTQPILGKCEFSELI